MVTLSFDIEQNEVSKISEILHSLGVKKIKVSEQESDAEEISESIKNILAQRLEEHQKNPSFGMSLDEARESLKKKYGF